MMFGMSLVNDLFLSTTLYTAKFLALLAGFINFSTQYLIFALELFRSQFKVTCYLKFFKYKIH